MNNPGMRYKKCSMGKRILTPAMIIVTGPPGHITDFHKIQMQMGTVCTLIRKRTEGSVVYFKINIGRKHQINVGFHHGNVKENGSIIVMIGYR
jgi:hypothetical protein